MLRNCVVVVPLPWAFWLCLTCGCSVKAAGAAEFRTIKAIYDFDRPQVQQVGNAVRLAIPDCQSLAQPGEPALPCRAARLLLPDGFKVAKASVRPLSGPITLEGRWIVDWGRTPQPRGNSIWPADLPRPITPPSPLIYESDLLFPSAHGQLVSQQALAGHRVALVRLSPLRYRPSSRRLELCPRLEVELTLIHDNANTTPPNRSKAYSMPERVAAFVDNPETLATSADPAEGGVAGAATASLAGNVHYDYLLITKAALLASFQPLVALKQTAGLAVKTETMENILTNFPGADAPERVRNCVRYGYTNWGISYVLLGGDIDTVPCRYGYVFANQSLRDSFIPSDLYYACLDGSWNRDGDDRWGEPTDGEDGGDVDLLAEVYVGRAPVDTVAEADVFVAKTVAYETGVAPNGTNALFVARYLGFYAPGVHAQGGDMLDPLLPHFSRFQVNWLDDRPYTNDQWSAGEVIGRLNQAPHVAVYNGHGDVDWIMELHPPDLDALTNAHPFLAYSVGCNAGEFDNFQFLPDSIGEELVKRHSRGAFAAILNSRLGWFNPENEEQFSGEFQRRFFEQLLVRGQTHLGVANQLSKHDLVGLVESSGLMVYRWCYYEIMLFGDPHTSFRLPTRDATSQGTPYAWLSSYGWTNNFEAAALADPDEDGMPAWQEYIAGTSPVDPESVLRLRCERLPGQESRLSWPSVAGRVYSIDRFAQVGEDRFERALSNIPATPPWNVWTNLTGPNPSTFFRLEVTYPP